MSERKMGPKELAMRVLREAKTLERQSGDKKVKGKKIVGGFKKSGKGSARGR